MTAGAQLNPGNILDIRLSSLVYGLGDFRIFLLLKERQIYG
jgi:hypothetical protein